MSPRRFYRRYRKGAKQNYQVERPYFHVTPTQVDGWQIVIPPAPVSGIRKVKNFSIEFSTRASERTFLWALVYIPAGYNANELVTEGQQVTTMYKPTQNVIMAGLYDPRDSSTSRRFTRMSRLLKEGDVIGLVYKCSQIPADFQFVVTYAITL